MDHIKHFDWCSEEPDVYFLNEADIDNSVTERILRNTFCDPLISSDSEEETQPKIKINWDEIFKKKKFEKTHRIVVPGIHPNPPFPKLSALTIQQHHQCLKVLCAQNHHILPAEFMPRPTKYDHKVFEELKETYAKEQKEFIEWAKCLWTSNHCVRALRPKPPIEKIYESEYKIATHKMKSFPKTYKVAAQIPLETPHATCGMMHEKDLINVNITTLPKINIPNMSEKVYIMRTYTVPEPCSMHPCRFQLPGENKMTILPLTEVHKELAQYAVDNGAQYIASEEALRCIMELDKNWLLTISVCQVIGPEGVTPVAVLDGPVWRARAAAPERSRVAYHKLLELALAPLEEMTEKTKNTDTVCSPSKTQSLPCEDDLSDDDNDQLYMDTDNLQDLAIESEDPDDNISLKQLQKDCKQATTEKSSPRKQDSIKENEFNIDFLDCNCGDTFDKPPQRSYKKWKVVNWTSNEKYSIIIHCPHRIRRQVEEVVLEPIPEYQLDMGASRQSHHAARAHALALTLRKNTSVLNVRIDSPTGEIVTTESVSLDELLKSNPSLAGDITCRLYTALDQLQGLLPGHYVLQHEPSHGDNAILHAASTAAAGVDLTLDFSDAQLADDADAQAVKTPPTLTADLLPVHKYRKMLPCAFTPYPDMLAKETKKPVARQKIPPRAITLGEAPGHSHSRGQWPKKKNKKKKKKNNNNTNG